MAYVQVGFLCLGCAAILIACHGYVPGTISAVIGLYMVGVGVIAEGRAWAEDRRTVAEKVQGLTHRPLGQKPRIKPPAQKPHSVKSD